MSLADFPRTLFLGYGNPGRQDDGLGPAFIEAARLWQSEYISLESNYQLTVEDALLVAEFERVVFVDASRVAYPGGFRWQTVGADMSQTNAAAAIASHQLSPETLLALSENLFDSRVNAYLLAIQGYDFDAFDECISPQAQRNLQAALRFVAEQWHLEPL